MQGNYSATPFHHAITASVLFTFSVLLPFLSYRICLVVGAGRRNCKSRTKESKKIGENGISQPVLKVFQSLQFLIDNRPLSATERARVPTQGKYPRNPRRGARAPLLPVQVNGCRPGAIFISERPMAPPPSCLLFPPKFE